MHIEYECTLLEVDKEEFIKKLEENKATKVGEFLQRRYTYDFKSKKVNSFFLFTFYIIT